RFTLQTPDVIRYNVTIDDPKTFTRPWQITMPIYRRMEPNIQLLDFRCTEFVEEFMYGSLRKQQLVKHWEGETIAVDITRKVPPGDKFYEWYGKVPNLTESDPLDCEKTWMPAAGHPGS